MSIALAEHAAGPASVDVALNVLDPHSLLSAFGPVGVAVVLFAETGLLVGFFLPGDSLLFTAGVIAAAPATASLRLPLAGVLVAAAVGACAGAQVGYLIGARAGPRLLQDVSRPRLREGRDRARRYLGRYGFARAIVLARFIPVVRTVLNPLAGAVGVPARVFALWQVVGGLIWSLGVTLAGYWLGSSVHNVDHYLLPIVAAVVVVSLIPLALELIRGRSSIRRTAIPRPDTRACESSVQAEGRSDGD